MLNQKIINVFENPSFETAKERSDFDLAKDFALTFKRIQPETIDLEDYRSQFDQFCERTGRDSDSFDIALRYALDKIRGDQPVLEKAIDNHYDCPIEPPSPIRNRLERAVYSIFVHLARLTKNDFYASQERMAEAIGATVQAYHGAKRMLIKYGWIEQTKPAKFGKCAYFRIVDDYAVGAYITIEANSEADDCPF